MQEEGNDGSAVEIRAFPHLIPTVVSIWHPALISMLAHMVAEDPSCKLWGSKGTLAHIKTECKTALTQSQYRWYHDNFVLVFADTLQQDRQMKREMKLFRRETSQTCRTGLNLPYYKWQVLVRWRLMLDGSLHFSRCGPYLSTSIDIVLWSPEEKTIMPCEEGCQKGTCEESATALGVNRRRKGM